MSNGNIINNNSVIEKVNISNRLEIKDVGSRSWIMDVLNCENKISVNIFSLENIYYFEQELQDKHPDNHNVKAKIRQQLQLLRDRGFIVTIEETITQNFTVVADTEEETKKIAEDKYRKGDFVLSSAEVQLKQMTIFNPKKETSDWNEF